MMPFYMTSLHVDLNEAAKMCDIIPLTLLASLSRLRTLVRTKVQNGDDIWPNSRSFMYQFMKVGGIKTLKELTIGVQQLVRLPSNTDFINPGLVLYGSFLVSTLCRDKTVHTKNCNSRQIAIELSICVPLCCAIRGSFSQSF